MFYVPAINTYWSRHMSFEKSHTLMLAEMICLQHQATQKACNSACISSYTAGDIGSLCDMFDCRLPNNLLTEAGIQRLRDVAKGTARLWLAWWATVNVILLIVTLFYRVPRIQVYA